MRVYSRIVLDPSGNIIESDHYDYSGPVSEAKGGGGTTVVQAPQQSPEELALLREQTALLREQRDVASEQLRVNNLLAPITFGSLGVKPIYEVEGDPNSRIVGFEQEFDPLQEKSQELEGALIERALKASRGEADVSPGLIEEIDQKEADLRETLRRQLGGDFETSSAGIEALSKFDTSKQTILDAARRGELTLSEQLLQSRQAFNQSEQLTPLQALNLTSAQFGPGQQFGQISQGFNSPISAFVNQRNAQLQASIATAQLNKKSGGASLAGPLIGAAGAMGAAAITAMSSRAYKHGNRELDHDKVLALLNTIPVEAWKYKGDEATHIGTYAEDFNETFGLSGGDAIYLLDAVGVLMSAVQALTKKVEELENGRS